MSLLFFECNALAPSRLSDILVSSNWWKFEDVELSMTPHWKGLINMGTEDLHNKVAELCTKVSGTALEAFAFMAEKALNVLSRSIRLEIEFSAGFENNSETGHLEAFIRLHFLIRIYGQEMKFDLEWRGDVDALISKIIKFLLKFLKKHLLKSCGVSKEAISESFKKVSQLFSRKKNKSLTKGDIKELQHELSQLKKRPEIAASLATLPDTIEIADNVPQRKSKKKSALFSFGGFKGKQFEGDKDESVEIGGGFTFKMPKKFNTHFKSKSFDITAERDRLQKEARKKKQKQNEMKEKKLSKQL